jgi:HAD superfamily hydrolase (TIGR01509 family)
MKHTWIVFDFFGVVCSEVAPIWLPRYLPRDAALAVKAELVSAADRGELSQEALFQALGARTSLPPERVYAEWFDHAKIDRRMVELIKKVSTQARVALLTNAASGFVRHVLSSYDIDSLFEVVLVSSECGCAKPDPLIYRILLRKLEVEPHQVVLIDDNDANIVGAKAAGISGIHFTSYDELLVALQSA